METLKRQENWTKSEVDAPTVGYLEHHAVIEAKFSPMVSSRDKDKAWAVILERYISLTMS